MHKSFRRGNVLFTALISDPVNETAAFHLQYEVDLRKPWIFRFEYSCPGSFFSQRLVGACPDRDVNRHPERQKLLVTMFKKIHDIYALSVVRLEIGKPNSVSRIQLYSQPMLTFNIVFGQVNGGFQSILRSTTCER